MEWVLRTLIIIFFGLLVYSLIKGHPEYVKDLTMFIVMLNIWLRIEENGKR